MENSSRNFSEIFIFRVVTQAVLMENSSMNNHEYVPIHFFSILAPEFLGRQTDHFTGKLIHSNFLTETIYDTHDF